MHAYIVLGKNNEDKVKELINKTSSKPYEFSIEKIEMVRELSQFMKLSLSEKTAIVIREIDKASIEGQNAFLKNLEEPQKNIIFVLTAKQEFGVLQTILSRCQIIRVKDAMHIPKNENAQEFLNLSSGEKLSLISNLKKREEALEFLEDFIHNEHKLLTAKGEGLNRVAAHLKIAQSTYDNLNSNGNVTLQLTNFVVQLDTAHTNHTKGA